MNKKILMTTLGLGLALTLTACGPKNEKADNPNAKNTAAVEANANKNFTLAQRLNLSNLKLKTEKLTTRLAATTLKKNTTLQWTQ